MNSINDYYNQTKQKLHLDINNVKNIQNNNNKDYNSKSLLDYDYTLETELTFEKSNSKDSNNNNNNTYKIDLKSDNNKEITSYNDKLFELNLNSFNTNIISVVLVKQDNTVYNKGIIFSNIDNSNLEDYLNKTLDNINDYESYKNLKKVI